MSWCLICSPECNNPRMPEPTEVNEVALRASCTRSLSWHGNRRPADLLAELPDDIAPDRYGDGGAVTELEAEVASLLGKPAAAFLPSGTMAQQVTLRVHADARGRRVVLFHPTCHLDHHGCTISSAGASATSCG
jgi:Beta-eliminating lyase